MYVSFLFACWLVAFSFLFDLNLCIFFKYKRFFAPVAGVGSGILLSYEACAFWALTPRCLGTCRATATTLQFGRDTDSSAWTFGSALNKPPAWRQKKSPKMKIAIVEPLRSPTFLKRIHFSISTRPRSLWRQAITLDPSVFLLQALDKMHEATIALGDLPQWTETLRLI